MAQIAHKCDTRSLEIMADPAGADLISFGTGATADDAPPERTMSSTLDSLYAGRPEPGYEKNSLANIQ